MDRLSLDGFEGGDKAADPDLLIAGIDKQGGHRLVFAELDLRDPS